MLILLPSYSLVLCQSAEGAAEQSNSRQSWPLSCSAQPWAPPPRDGWEAPGKPPAWPERNIKRLRSGLRPDLINCLMRAWSTSPVLFLSKNPLCLTMSVTSLSSSSLIICLGGGWGRTRAIRASPTWMFLFWLRGCRSSLFLQLVSSTRT